MNLLRATGIKRTYGSLQVLKGIDLEVEKGEVVAIVGPSGAGKSTFLHILGTLDRPDQGQVFIEDINVFTQKDKDLAQFRNEKVGFIFQFHNLLPFLDSTENVVEAMQLYGTPARIARQRTAALLEYLDVGHRRHAMPGQLSGGEAQRVAIARALANSPRIILADEPTAALDSQRAAVVMDLLRRVATDHAATILVVTHDEKIFGGFDRLVRLRDGRVEMTAFGQEAATSGLSPS